MASVVPQAIYHGPFPFLGSQESRVLRIATGGAGQSGLLGAWANAFIQYCVSIKNVEPFAIAWVLGDTTQSLAYLALGYVDLAVTYVDAAELQSLKLGHATERKAGFLDHFIIVGPENNPANLDPEKDNALEMFNKIAATGNLDVITPPTNRKATRFLSRNDQSATNIKECELMTKIGQAPWAYGNSTWYHRDAMFPIQALEAAAALQEYTLTDRGTWLSSKTSVTDGLKIFLEGSNSAQDPLINIARVLLGAKHHPANTELCSLFMDWVVSESGGQKVVREFQKNGVVLYDSADLLTDSKL